MPSEQFLTFLGWAAFWNVVLLVVATILIVLFREPFARIHGRMFGVDAEFAKREYFRFIAGYEILTLVFFVIPYLVLKFGV